MKKYIVFMNNKMKTIITKRTINKTKRKLENNNNNNKIEHKKTITIKARLIIKIKSHNKNNKKLIKKYNGEIKYKKTRLI